MSATRNALFRILGAELGRTFEPEAISDDQSIEDLGVSSLNLMNLIYRVEDEFGFTADTNDILEVSTVGDMLRLIEAKAQKPVS
jgi:acyl carrier protein